MPRVKPLIQKRGETLIALLWGMMAVQSTNVAVVADKTGIKKSTLYRRKKSPEDMTLGEILTMGKALHIPIDDIRQAIRY